MLGCLTPKKKCDHDEADSCDCPENERKPLDVNKYATKKTIAQGMLDIALLTANASQLKYILQVGKQHEFYSLMLGLIVTSLILQVLVGILLLSLNFMRDCRLHLLEYKTSANYINYITTALSIAITAINLLISAFDPSLARFASSVDLNNNDLLPRLDFLKAGQANVTLANCTTCSVVGDRGDPLLNYRGPRYKKAPRTDGQPHPQRRHPPPHILDQFRQRRHFLLRHGILQQPAEAAQREDRPRFPVSVASLNLILTQVDFLREEHEILSNVLNHIATGCAMLAMVSDVIKMSFGLDPALSVGDFYRNATIK